MKLTAESQLKDEVTLPTLQDQLPVKRDLQLLGRMEKKKIPLWSLDIVTGVLEPAKIESVADIASNEVKHKVIVMEKTLYVQALNRRNAERKFSQMISDMAKRNYGVNCLPEVWKVLKFEAKVTLLRNLWK